MCGIIIQCLRNFSETNCCFFKTTFWVSLLSLLLLTIGFSVNEWAVHKDASIGLWEYCYETTEADLCRWAESLASKGKQ